MHLPKFIKPFRLISAAIVLLLICSLISLSARLALSSSPGPQSTSTQLGPAVETAQTRDFGQAFQELGIEGSIVIYYKNNQRFYEHNRFHCQLSKGNSIDQPLFLAFG